MVYARCGGRMVASAGLVTERKAATVASPIAVENFTVDSGSDFRFKCA